MDPKCFVDEMSRLAPDVPRLEAVGLKKSEVDAFRASFVADEREGSCDRDGDALLQLLTRWDLSRVEVGMLRFLARPVDVNRKICVGYVEADPLCLSEATGEIVVEDLEAPGHILWFVAETGSALMDALMPAARFLAHRAIGETDVDDKEATGAVVQECTSLAGGKRFWKFYAMLLGAT